MNAGWTDGATHADGQTGRPQEESWGAGGPVKEAELRPSSLLPHSAGNGLAASLLLTGCIDCSLTCQSVNSSQLLSAPTLDLTPGFCSFPGHLLQEVVSNPPCSSPAPSSHHRSPSL